MSCHIEPKFLIFLGTELGISPEFPVAIVRSYDYTLAQERQEVRCIASGQTQEEIPLLVSLSLSTSWMGKTLVFMRSIESQWEHVWVTTCWCWRTLGMSSLWTVWEKKVKLHCASWQKLMSHRLQWEEAVAFLVLNLSTTYFPWGTNKGSTISSSFSMVRNILLGEVHGHSGESELSWNPPHYMSTSSS